MNMMNKTSLTQKFLLILFGVFVTFLILEVGMRIGGFTLSFLQERQNKISLDEDEVRILCIGESTTAMGGSDSYPSQLEDILNEKSKTRKFNVINKGVISTNSDEILANLEGYLNKYQPHIVISMMGINDYLIERNVFSFKGKGFFKKLKVFQLFELIRLKLMQARKNSDQEDGPSGDTEAINALIEVEEKAQERSDDGSSSNELDALIAMFISSEEISRKLIQTQNESNNPLVRMKISSIIKKRDFKAAWILVRIGRNFRTKSDYINAEKFFNMAIAKDSGNVGAFIELGRCYKEQKQYKRALSYFKEASKLNPNSILVYIEKGNCYAALGDNDEAYRIANIILDKGPQNYEIASEIGSWFKGEKYFDFAERSLLNAIEKNKGSDLLYENLADFYSEHERKEKADEFYHKAHMVGAEMKGYPMVTVHNYNKIADIVGRNGIKFMAMQYPRREIEPLKNLFRSSYSIFFVENKKNFERALEYEPFRDYFSDRFGGDFGHCTVKGNRLIAENAANIIIRDILM